MKNLARACIFGSIASVAMATTLVACENGQFIGPWSLAPSGGSIPDAEASGTGGSGLADAHATNDGNTTATDSSAEGGSAEGGDAGPIVTPYPSVTIATGNGFGCYIDGQGNVWCWGSNVYGQAGSTPSSALVNPPQQVAGVTGATAIALGDYHACAVSAKNAVYCWGLNNSYQLGHTPSQSSGDVGCPGAGNQPVPCNSSPSVVNGVTAVGIAAAGGWTCTVGIDGSVSCWGAEQDGSDDGGAACGVGTAASGGNCYAGPYTVSGVGSVTQLAVAFDHACALVNGSAVTCWGNNAEEQVTHGYCANFDCAPVGQTLLPAATSVAVGTGFSCAVVADGGTVNCFGDNTYGELGHAPGTLGDTSPDGGGQIYNFAPQAVGGLGAVEELVASGSQAACAVLGGGSVECWGNVASSSAAGVPIVVSGLPAMTSLGVPDDDYACGIAGDGGIWCWTLSSGAAPAQLP